MESALHIGNLTGAYYYRTLYIMYVVN